MQNSVPFSANQRSATEGKANVSPSSSVPCPAAPSRILVVLADDITGAAEIAGIAHSHGLKTKLTTTIGTPADGCDVLVLATDWRQMTEAAAMDESRRATAFYKKSLTQGGKSFFIFKKTDSVLRGHILAECHGMLSALNENDVVRDENGCCADSDNRFRVLLIPQNPSKGRVVRNGLYYINEKPIAETSFSFDPEFPAKSSVVNEVLQNNLQDKSLSANIITTDAETVEEIQEIVLKNLDRTSLNNNTAVLINNNTAQCNENVIFAGGADLFSSILSVYHNLSPQKSSTYQDGRAAEKTLIVCGSTQSTDISQTRFSKENNLISTKMPSSVFHGDESPESWLNNLQDLNKNHNLILTIGHKPQGGQEYAIRLRNLMAQAVKNLIQCSVENSKENITATHLLIIEGGATAYQILQTLNWTEFTVNREYAPGVVELLYNSKPDSKENISCRIILKPGSYPWGNLFA